MDESNLEWRTSHQEAAGNSLLPSASLSFPCPAELAGLSDSMVQRLSPAALAYIGDAVFELFIRLSYLMPPKRQTDYHNQVVSHVRAERQAEYLQSLESYLTDKELEIVKRGRNAASKGHRRASPGLYQQATGLEALIGYLYLTNPQRLVVLFAHLEPELKGPDSVRNY